MQAPRDPAGWRPLIDPVKVISGPVASRFTVTEPPELSPAASVTVQAKFPIAGRAPGFGKR